MKRIEVYISEADMLLDHLRAAGRKISRMRRALLSAAETLSLCDGDGDRARRFNDTGLPEDGPVRALCERVGYGAVMDSAARQWFAKENSGAFTVGPCAGTVRRTRAELAAALADKPIPRKVQP